MVDASPTIPVANKISPATPAIKIATPDIILENNERISPDIMLDLIFENIGGQEIIDMVRNDLVNGQNVVYQPIKNLLDINLQNNPKNILSLENTSETIFNNFPIRLDVHIPSVGNGPNGSNVYMDPLNGNIVIDLINMQNGEQVEVQISTAGVLLDDTIY